MAHSKVEVLVLEELCMLAEAAWEVGVIEEGDPAAGVEWDGEVEAASTIR